MPDLGGLRAKLGLDTSEVDAGLDRANKGFDVAAGTIKGYQKALLGLSFLLGSISEGDSKSFNQLRRILQQSVTTITGTTFALQSLGGSFAKFAGPIGIAVGVLGGIASALSDVNKQATEEKKRKLDEYADTLKRVADAMGAMTKDAEEASRAVLTFNIESAQKKLDELQAQLGATLTPAELRAQQAGFGEFYRWLFGLKGAEEISKKIKEKEKEIDELNLKLRSIGGVVPGKAPLTPEDVEADREKREKSFLDEMHERLVAQRAAMQEGSEIDQVLADRRNANEEELDQKKKERLQILADVQNDLISNELARRIDAIEDEYALRQSTLLAVGAMEAEISQARAAADKKIADARFETAEDLRQKQAQSATEELSQVQGIVDMLQRGFSRAGDTFLSKLFQALQLAVQISQAMQAASAKTGGGTFLDSLGIGASFFTGFLGFAGGGYTGAGARMKPAGVVHRGEYVFEKPIVDRHGPMLASLRDNLQRSAIKGYASGGMVGSTGGPLIQSSGSLMREIRSIRDDIRGLQINVNLRGTLTGQKFLKEEQPRYEAFMKGKQS